MKQMEYKAHDSGEVLDKKAGNKGAKRRYYRNLIIRSVSSFFIGIVFMAFLEAHGLGGALLCLLFGASCFGFALCLD